MAGKHASGNLSLTWYYWACQVFPMVYFESLKLDTILEHSQMDSVAEW